MATEAQGDPQPITPLTALRVDEEGRLTYMGQDGQRYVIVGNAELLQRLNDDDAGGPGGTNTLI